MSKLFGGNKHKQYPSAARSEKIRRDTAVFLANGGEIKIIPVGMGVELAKLSKRHIGREWSHGLVDGKKNSYG